MLLDGLQLVTLADNGIESPDEPGTTFTENAVIKAIHAAPLSGLPAVADDWGREVDLLAGRPSIFSLASSPSTTPAHRKSEGTTVMAMDQSHGSIVEPAGSNGFCCKPIVEFNDERTVGELSPPELNDISHGSRTPARILPLLPHVPSCFSRKLLTGYVVNTLSILVEAPARYQPALPQGAFLLGGAPIGVLGYVAR